MIRAAIIFSLLVLGARCALALSDLAHKQEATRAAWVAQ